MPLKSLGEFIRKHVFNNFTAKVMALAMALGLWLYAYKSSYTQYDKFPIPVHVHMGDERWSVVHGENLQVTVTLSCPRRFEEKFKQELIARSIYIDCSNVTPEPGALDHDTVTVPLKKELLVTPRDFSLKIESFNPSELKIELIRETARMVPVVPKTSVPPPGYRVEYAFPLTPTVMIRGQEDIVAQLFNAGIETEKIDISSPPPGNLTEWEVLARIPSSVTIGGKSYPISCTDQVQCLIHLARLSVEANFTDVPIELLVPPGYSYVATLYPPLHSTTNVQVTGPQDDVDALKKGNIHILLYVDVRDPKLVPQETPYTQPICAQIVDENQRPKIIPDMVIKPEVSTCAVKISEARPK